MQRESRTCVLFALGLMEEEQHQGLYWTRYLNYSKVRAKTQQKTGSQSRCGFLAGRNLRV